MLNTTTGRTSFAYDYGLSFPDGFWSTPEPTLTNLATNSRDRIGSFKRLFAPTISKYWSFSTQPQFEDAEEENAQAQAERPSRRLDSLVKSAVPGKCKEEDLESFLSGKPLADWRVQVPDQQDGRYLEVDSELFQNT